ncbi:N-acetyltransferase 9 isoform X1 [Python bivittatus]|uniref:N-acetyltransferase 9 isoform X1 n=1 Tax=Python bivittatus TaxID=176946 RepID=A0A9F5J606_PYTBI|nr:N-acetyltransferase 9 isoform X1 [Python bivittatus]XP_025027570.1 N-acetyltransferase 9 isoform X1 [Python bivittatus]XP_025027571.1 N-acetyltransferase 9 isoform X1 [Python bivittatus]
MKINQNTVLQGKRVTLVPYTPAHVPRYHEWMKSEELQRLTASEPLSLEQEYEMQCSWREDTDSEISEYLAGLGNGQSTDTLECTFIILDAEKWSRQKATEEDCMVGDVNLFLTNSEEPTVGEIEIMIAEPSYRGRGFGKEATLIMMSYGITHLGLSTFEAKIGLENETSIGMFKKLHFKEVGVNSIFQEMTLKLIVDEQEKQWLCEQTNEVTETKYSVMKLQHHNCDS